MKQLRGTELKRFLRKTKKEIKELSPVQEINYILHDIEYDTNIGSIFRIADACGVNKIFISGMTSSPDKPKIRKVSRNKTKSIPWERVEDLGILVSELKEEGHSICALEITDESKSMYEYSIPDKITIIVGHEDHGIPQAILDLCDESVFIPMLGKGKSLNVHVALAVFNYYLIQTTTT